MNFIMSRKAILLICASVVLCSLFCRADEAAYENPIIRYSLPDPTVLRDDDGTYWLYATEDTHNVPIWYSTDLVHWTFSGTAFTDSTRPKIVSGGGIWAPHIIKIGGKYLLYYSMSTWGGTWTCGIGVATADHPYGPFTGAHTLFTSKDINVENSIDPFVWSEDGHNYLFWGSFHDIYGLELTEDGLSLKEGSTKQKIAGGLIEGTTICKHGDYYYLIGSAGSCCEGANSTYRLVVARSKNLFGPYTDRNNKKAYDNNFSALLNGTKKVAGPGHCSSIVKDDAGNDWLIYHGYLADEPDRGRLTFLDAITWRSNWPTIYRSQPSTSATVPTFHSNDTTATRSQIELADPFIVAHDGRYYAYGTHSADGIECYTSTDLNTWHYEGLALDRLNTAGPLDADSVPTRINSFSEPKVYPWNNRWYMYFTADGHTSVATSDTPSGPFVQEGSWITKSVLKKEASYQPCVACDADGCYLLIRRDGSGQGIWRFVLEDDGITASRPLMKVLSAPTDKKGTAHDWELLSGKTLSSPFVMQHDEQYIMLYTANDTLSPLRGIGAATATAIATTWKKDTGGPLLMRTDDLVGIGGASLFSDADGTLHMVFHAWNSVSTREPLRMYIADVTYDDGVLRLTDTPIRIPQLDVSTIHPLPADPIPSAATYDLQGRRAVPTTPGIHITQGTKVLKRKEE